MIGTILLGIFGNSIYDLIKGSLKDSFIEKDDDLIGRIHTALEEASKEFFLRYGDQFGQPESSFLARQANIEIIVKSIFYGNNFELVESLSSKGFDGAKDLDQEALYFFCSKLTETMMKDFRINKIIIEKNHIKESKETSNKIIELLDGLLQQQQKVEVNSKEEKFDEWKITDLDGNESQIVEGKQYFQRFPNGVEYSFMFKAGLIYVEILDLHGQKSYYELDINGNVKDTKFPHPLSEYKLVISEDQIVHKNVIKLENGFYREVIMLKWDKQADVVFNDKGELQNINLHGGWEVKHNERSILPSL